MKRFCTKLLTFDDTVMKYLVEAFNRYLEDHGSEKQSFEQFKELIHDMNYANGKIGFKSGMLWGVLIGGGVASIGAIIATVIGTMP